MKIDAVLSEPVLEKAIKHIHHKKGTSAIDTKIAANLPDYWQKHGMLIIEKIRKGSYIPHPVTIFMIPKPGSNEKRKLEIPCVVDRLILHALNTALCPYFDSHFSKYSYGFRKNIRCIDALNTCLEFLNQQCRFVVDLDIRNFFDCVNHDLLLQRLQRDITDPALFGLIKKYIKIDVKNGKHIYQNDIGLPQGSSVSPLLANIFLDSFDQYMERQNIKFVRYADDIIIFCQTKEDAIHSFSLAKTYLTQTLKLTLNEEKTSILQPEQLHYLGYGFAREAPTKAYELAIDEKTEHKMMEKMKKHLDRRCTTPEEWWDRLGSFHRGWVNSYKYASSHTMIPFLQKAEEQELTYFLQNVCCFNEQVFQKYISALFNCPSYSSLTGWYKLKATQNNPDSNRRIKNMKNINKMYHNLSHWRTAQFFSEKQNLITNYQKLLSKPEYYKARYDLELCHFSGDKQPLTEAELDNKALIIIGILAAGTNMTLAQLNSYLLLKNIETSSESLLQSINRLINLGIVNRTTIYLKNPYLENATEDDTPYLNCYQVTETGKWFAEQMDAPQDFPTERGYCKEYNKFYTDTILYNQIVLNYLLYCPAFKYFKIDSINHILSHRKLTALLYIATEEGDYCFSSPDVFKQEISCKKLTDWKAFQNNRNTKSTFVLLEEDYEELQKTKNTLYSQTLLLNQAEILDLSAIATSDTPPSDNILDDARSLKYIAFSVVHSWFNDSAGRIIPYEELSK
ncbi:MAG: hypothetical protein HFI74_02725 [Lachnospiraceae bacterium]|jgi:RNA-directed DNA polymerase|nr:hypothetical protein [Lachnospiraceae bacterium]